MNKLRIPLSMIEGSILHTMNKLVLSFGMTQNHAEVVQKLLVEGNQSFTGLELWQHLNDAGYFIVPQQWLLNNVKADKIIHGIDANKPV